MSLSDTIHTARLASKLILCCDQPVCSNEDKMEGAINNLSLVTYNCFAFISSLLDVKNLINYYQIIFHQENLLAKQQRGKILCFGASHFAFELADCDVMMVWFWVVGMVELPYIGLKSLKLW